MVQCKHQGDYKRNKYYPAVYKTNQSLHKLTIKAQLKKGHETETQQTVHN